MLAVGGASFAEIHSNVKDGASDASDKLALGERRALEMKAAHHAVGRHGLVVLNEGDRIAQ